MFFYVKNSQSCHYLEIIQAQSLKDQRFLAFDIKKIGKRHIRKPPLPERQNDVVKEKIDL